jgi:hypothetical protein
MAVPPAPAAPVPAAAAVGADAIPEAQVVVVPGRGGRDGRGGHGGRDGHGGRGSRGGGGGRGGGGRVNGKWNYKNDVLIKIVEDLRPYGSEGWASVSAQYREASEEDDFRDPKDLKEHWIWKLCNNYKKPTGKTGEPGDRIHRCQEIDRLINLDNEARVMGATSGEEEEIDDGYVSSGMEDISAGGNDGHADQDDAEGGAENTAGAVNTVGADNTADNAEGGVVSVTTAQRSIPPRPTSRTCSMTGSSSRGKQKI